MTWGARLTFIFVCVYLLFKQKFRAFSLCYGHSIEVFIGQFVPYKPNRPTIWVLNIFNLFFLQKKINFKCINIHHITNNKYKCKWDNCWHIVRVLSYKLMWLTAQYILVSWFETLLRPLLNANGDTWDSWTRFLRQGKQETSLKLSLIFHYLISLLCRRKNRCNKEICDFLFWFLNK